MILTPEQIADRRNGIGSSQVAALAGLHRFSSPIDVYQEIMGESTFQGNEQTRIGHVLEGPIGRMAADQLFLDEISQAPVTYRHRDHDWARATPDFLVGRGSILEVKNVGYHMRHDWANGAPDYFVAQLQWQLEVLDRGAGYIGALIGGREIVTFCVPRDEKYGRGLLKIASDFWHNHVVPQVPPPPDGSEGYADFVKRSHPVSRGEAKQPSGDVERWAISLKSARQAMASAKADEAKYANKIKSWLGDAPEVLTSIGRITWRTSKGRAVTDWQAVATEAIEAAGMSDGDALELSSKHTSSKPGSRRFNPPRDWSK